MKSIINELYQGKHVVETTLMPRGFNSVESFLGKLLEINFMIVFDCLSEE